MKKILSLAIAAAMVAPAAAMAEASFYGSAHMVIQNTDDGTDDVWGVDTATASVGVKGSEDLGDGLKAIYQFEYEMNQDNGDGLSDNNQYIGLAGGFGTVLFGRHDTPLQMSQGSFDQFGSVAGDIKTVIPGEDGVDNVIAYVSPAMSGLTLVGAVVAGEEGDSVPDGTCSSTITNDEGVEVCLEENYTVAELTGLADHVSIAGLYSNGPIFASLAFNSYDLGSANEADPSLLRGTFIWNGGNWQAGAMYSSMETDGLLDLEDSDAFGVSGHLKVGSAGKVKAQYLVADSPVINASALGFTPEVNIAGGDSETTQISVGYEHALSKRTTLHAGYTTYEVEVENADNTEEDTLFVGMIHNF
jgi:predicted porin